MSFNRQLARRALLALLCAALEMTGLSVQEKAPPAGASGSLDTALIERLTGAKGALDPAAGSDSQSVVDGDFAMEERELQAVLKPPEGRHRRGGDPQPCDP